MYMEACRTAEDRNTADRSMETRDGDRTREDRRYTEKSRKSGRAAARIFLFRGRGTSCAERNETRSETESLRQGQVLVYRSPGMNAGRQRAAESQQKAERVQESVKAGEPQGEEDSTLPVLQRAVDDAPLVLFVGTSPNKNLIRAAMALQGLRCTLVVLGNLTVEQKELLSVLTPGYQNLHDLSDEQVVSLYQKVRSSGGILLFPSWYEGFGRPVIEAQAVGLPVVAGDIPVLHETSGEAALFVDPGQTESIRNAVVRLLYDSVLYERLSEKGKENALRYGSREAAEKYRELYQLLAFTRRYQRALQRMKEEGQIPVRSIRREAEKKALRQQA